MDHEPDYTPQSPFLCGLKGTCPRCGQGRIFTGFLMLKPACSYCGLNFHFADSGDGPAVFVSLIGGFLVLGAALWTELRYEPPFYVHLLIFLPLTLLVCLGLLRPLKATLIALQYRNKAEQGRLLN
ncbi:MAG: DUF983 domain-containing protein [Alphaproteobacteria bacterium]|nr:DUF983 domain-containing protein [Alphaproteobacteria bacterium]